MPPSVLVSFLDLGHSEEKATVSIGIHGHVIFFDTWHLFMLQRRRLGVQRSSIYAILVAMMASLGCHAMVASVVEFCISRVATSNFESHSH